METNYERTRRTREQRRRKRRLKRMLRVGIRIAFLLILLMVPVLAISVAVKGMSGLLETQTEAVTPNYYETTEMTATEVRKTDIYQYVLDHAEQYPDDMATKLQNNPEILPFVEHYLDYEPTARGGINREESREHCPLFLQWDERWGYAAYGDDNIGFSGCGPACVSMAVYYLTGDESATPDAIGRFAMENGYYVYGTGTSWDLMTAAPSAYGVSVSTLNLDEARMKSCLDAGQVLIASMGQGDFTTTGHFIVIYGYNEDGFFVNDPNSRKRSNKVWSFDNIGWQIRNLWVYYK